MKKLIVMGIVMTMMMGLAVVANAAFDVDWVINLKVATTEDGTGSFYTGSARTKGTYSDGKAAEDSVAPPAGAAGMVYAYTTVGGFNLSGDYRGSFTGTTKTWTLNFTSVRFAEGQAPTQVYFFAWNPANVPITAPNNDWVPTTETIKLYKGTGLTRDLVWTLNGLVNGTGVHGNAATYESGLISIGSVYELEVAEAVIPEPGSIVALMSGLVGLVGYGIRRRK